MLKAIHAQEDKEAARQKTIEVVKKLQALHLDKAAKILESDAMKHFPIMPFPQPIGGISGQITRLNA